MGPNPTIRRQVQVGFSEESTYGLRLDTAPIIRPVVRTFEITPTQARMNIGRTGSIDPSRTFFSTQTYDYSMTVEVDPHMAMWFLKWSLGPAFDISMNNYRVVPVPLDNQLTSFSIYLDTNQIDFIDTNQRTLLFFGGMVESLAMRSAGTEDDKSVTFEISGPVQQPNVEDDYPYSMIGAGLTLPAAHPTIGTTNADIIPYIHQNFGASVAEPVGFNIDMLDSTLTINNSLKMNTYPDGDNEPFFSEIIYQGRNIQLEWTAEYKDMTEYRTFHEAIKVLDMLWGGQHILQYDGTNQYSFNCYMPSVAISNASQIMSAGEAEETLEQTYTADLLNRAIEVDTTATTPTDQETIFADDDARHAYQITVPGTLATPTVPSPDPDKHLSFVQLLLTKTVDLADGVDLTMTVVPSNTAGTEPEAGGAVLATSKVVKTDWISNQVVSFVFDNTPRLAPGAVYFIVLQSSAAIPSTQLSVSGDATGGVSADSDDAGATWNSGTVQWVSKAGYGGFPLVIEIATDADITI